MSRGKSGTSQAPSSLQELKARCRVHEESGCWELLHLDGGPYSSCPQYGNFHKDRGPITGKTIMQIALELSGQTLLPGHVTRKSPKCTYRWCCNPGHLRSDRSGNSVRPTNFHGVPRRAPETEQARENRSEGALARHRRERAERNRVIGRAGRQVFGD